MEKTTEPLSRHKTEATFVSIREQKDPMLIRDYISRTPLRERANSLPDLDSANLDTSVINAAEDIIFEQPNKRKRMEQSTKTSKAKKEIKESREII